MEIKRIENGYLVYGGYKLLTINYFISLDEALSFIKKEIVPFKYDKSDIPTYTEEENKAFQEELKRLYPTES